MTALRRFGVMDMLMFLVVLAGAAGARAWYVNTCAQGGLAPGPFQVQEDDRKEQLLLVGNLKEGQGFTTLAPLAKGVEPTAHVAPLYPWLLSLLDQRMPNRDATDQAWRWIQVGLGTLTAGLYFLFARRAFHSLLAGTLAGLLTAFHPFWIVNAAEINDGVLATFLLAVCLFLGARGSQGGAALSSLLYGVGLAGLALVRAALVPFAFVAVLAFLWRCRRLPRGWLYAVLAVLGFVNGLLPWALRNYQAFGEVMPVADSAYFHLWVGNNSLATGGPESAATIREALGEDRAKQLEGMAQPVRYRALAQGVVDEVRNNPAGTLQRRLRAGIGFFLGMNFLDANGLDSRALYGEDERTRDDVPTWLTDILPAKLAGSLLVMLLLGGIGWRWSFGWRHESIPAAVAMIWIPLPYLLSHAERLHGPRLPLDGVMLCYVAFVLACLVPGVGRSLLCREEGESAAP
jgi:4-amino-4-deoxy-L-arabinose transferase-like glycosyltransferase